MDNNLNPFWKPFSIPARKLCNNDAERELTFAVVDHDSDGSHDHIGSVRTTLAALVMRTRAPARHARAAPRAHPRTRARP